MENCCPAPALGTMQSQEAKRDFPIRTNPCFHTGLLCPHVYLSHFSGVYGHLQLMLLVCFILPESSKQDLAGESSSFCV